MFQLYSAVFIKNPSIHPKICYLTFDKHFNTDNKTHYHPVSKELCNIPQSSASPHPYHHLLVTTVTVPSCLIQCCDSESWWTEQLHRGPVSQVLFLFLYQLSHLKMAHKLSHMGVLIFRAIFPLNQTHIHVRMVTRNFHDFSQIVVHSPVDSFIIYNKSMLIVSNDVNTHPSIIILKIFRSLFQQDYYLHH